MERALPKFEHSSSHAGSRASPVPLRPDSARGGANQPQTPRPEPGGGTDLEQILRLLERYLSPVNARVLLERALRERNLSMQNFAVGDLPRVSGPLRRGIELWVERDKRKGLLQEVARFCGHDTLRPAPCSIAVTTEADITTVRNEARRICEDVGAKSFTTHKIVTIVSELARNIVSYSKGGSVEVVPLKELRSRVVIRATDRGPGINNLAEILSGTYRSKTGLGKGILGTKRLADQFDISTGADGTHVVAEIFV